MWRCPHCGTPQAETARCWVCHRSSTSCGTCRHFRRSVAVKLGYCGLDRRRLPLAGDEMRGCWEARRSVEEPLPVAPVLAVRPRQPARDQATRLDFVEVSAEALESAVIPAEPVPGRVPPPPPTRAEPSWSLWGDLDG